jgi:hypothetical protein
MLRLVFFITVAAAVVEAATKMLTYPSEDLHHNVRLECVRARAKASSAADGQSLAVPSCATATTSKTHAQAARWRSTACNARPSCRTASKMSSRSALSTAADMRSKDELAVRLEFWPGMYQCVSILLHGLQDLARPRASRCSNRDAHVLRSRPPAQRTASRRSPAHVLRGRGLVDASRTSSRSACSSAAACHSACPCCRAASKTGPRFAVNRNAVSDCRTASGTSSRSAMRHGLQDELVVRLQFCRGMLQCPSTLRHGLQDEPAVRHELGRGILQCTSTAIQQHTKRQVRTAIWRSLCVCGSRRKP